MKHLTVVYAIANEECFASEFASIMDRFSRLGDEPWGIAAVTTDHEIKRLEFVEEALRDEDFQLAKAVLSHADIGSIKSLGEL